MRKLNEQWIENGRMYKAVLPSLCDVCAFKIREDKERGIICKHGKCVTTQGSVHDLGPVNEDGLLACPFCGEYPKSVSKGTEYSDNGGETDIFYIEHSCNVVQTTEFTYSEQQSIDDWNWRA